MPSTNRRRRGGPEKLGSIHFVAMLVEAQPPSSMAANKELFADVEFQFIGTGKSPNDEHGFNIKGLAEQYGLWQTIVFEYPKRIPYLDVLVHLSAVDAVFILGSTEPHYTPSKAYQGVLSGKPILAVLHSESTAVNVLEESAAGIVLAFDGEKDLEKIYANWVDVWNRFCSYARDFDPASVRKEVFEQYSAKAVTRQLAALLDELVPENRKSRPHS